jgi:hypothetical protein
MSAIYRDRVAVVSAFIIVVFVVILPVVLFFFVLVWFLPQEQLHGYRTVRKVGSDAFVGCSAHTKMVRLRIATGPPARIGAAKGQNPAVQFTSECKENKYDAKGY